MQIKRLHECMSVCVSDPPKSITTSLALSTLIQHTDTVCVSVCEGIVYCVYVYARVSVFLACRAREEAVAKDAGKVCSFGVLLPVCFSLYGPSSAGWGWRVRPSPRGLGAVGTSKLLVTTGSGIQLNTHTDKCTQKHTYTH